MRALEGVPSRRAHADLARPGPGTLAALVVILHRSSLLPWDKFKAIMDTARYGYWDDDIEHRSYFIHFQAG
jgi:hypothetical protein